MYKNFQSAVRASDAYDDTDLIRVVYISRAKLIHRVKSAQTLSAIEEVAVAHNKQHEISGILCYGNGYFLQCLEGQKQDVMPLLARIFADKRHSQINVIELKAIAVRNFVNWGMRSLLLEDWYWKDIHQDYVTKLGYYIPFLPNEWSEQRIKNFLSEINRTDVPFITSKSGSYISLDDLSLSSDYLFVQILFIIFTCLLIYFYIVYLK